MTLATFLKSKRVSAELSQKDVAKHMRYTTPQFVSNWERGVSSPPVREIKKLANLYKVSEKEFFEVYLNDILEEKRAELTRKFAGSR